jgi:hypothetical protein
MDLKAQLEPANARTAIENLMFSYAECIDGGDFDGIGKLFARARILAADGALQGEGREGVRAIYERSTKLYEDGTPMTQHVTTNLILNLGDGGRTASVRSRFTVMMALPDFPLQAVITGYYEDQFAWDDEAGWHFTERKMKPKLLGDLSRHLKYEYKAPESD